MLQMHKWFQILELKRKKQGKINICDCSALFAYYDDDDVDVDASRNMDTKRFI